MCGFAIRQVLTFLAVTMAVSAAQPCLAPESIWSVRGVADPQLAPDGKSVAYVQSWNDPIGDLGYSNLRLIRVDGGAGQAITEGKYHDGSPRWSPDARRIAYLSDRGGKAAIHVLELSTNHDAPVAPGTRISSLAWSPDGKFLAFMAYVETPSVWAPPMPAAPPGAHWAPPAVAITNLRWTFDGIGVLKPGGTRIFVVPAAGGEARQISRDPYQHTFYVGEPDLAWSRDSRSVLAPAVKATDGWAVYDGNQIYAFPADGGEPRQITKLQGQGLEPRPSPDGSLLAFTGYDWRGHSYHVSKLRVVDAAGGSAREITTDWDRDVANPAWSSDSRRLYFLSDNRGDVSLFETNLKGQRKRITNLHERIQAFSIAAGRAVIVYSNPTSPPALAVFDLASPDARKILVDPNRERISGCVLSTAEEIWYKSFDGSNIQGWILKPPGFSPARRYPLLVSMHGGPHGSYGPSFSPDLQMFADHGYVVLYTNPRGSTGYGEAFGNSIQHKWPGDDIKDVLAGADFVLAKGYTDPNRMAVIGGSGGGLMTAWMIGHTDRFRAAVALYPVTNWFTHVGSDDNGFYIASVYRKGMPWDFPQDYIEHSPLFYANHFKTPTMIISGDEDWRVPIAQSQELFRALKVRGVDTVLIRVPGESHGVRKRPSHQIATLVNSLAWLDKYVDPQPK
jgi:dipeptidyl aminopeptidase/acylaminoacyl peptidase